MMNVIDYSQFWPQNLSHSMGSFAVWPHCVSIKKINLFPLPLDVDWLYDLFWLTECREGDTRCLQKLSPNQSLTHRIMSKLNENRMALQNIHACPALGWVLIGYDHLSKEGNLGLRSPLLLRQSLKCLTDEGDGQQHSQHFGPQVLSWWGIMEVYHSVHKYFLLCGYLDF